jgi:hypothetical protein
MPHGHVFIELSGQRIGEPLTGQWCSTCNLPSAILIDMAVLVKPFGVESYEADPVAKVLTLHVCHECGTIFELPMAPSLVDNRDA